MEWISRKYGNDLNDIEPHEDSFVRLRGLPFSANKEDIISFFSGMPSKPLIVFTLEGILHSKSVQIIRDFINELKFRPFYRQMVLN